MWSSQHYKKRGIELGIEEGILDRAALQIEALVDKDQPAILTLKHLAVRTNSNYHELRRMVSNSSNFYRLFRIRKRSGGHRLISIPSANLMHVQRWIAEYVLKHLPVHPCSHAFKPGSSILKCANKPRRSKWLVKMDVSGFFGSISEIQVYRIYREIGYEPLVAFELTRLTTHAPNSTRYTDDIWQAAFTHSSPIEEYNSHRIGFLPQGAPTSPMLSNLVMRNIDKEIQAVASAAGLRYTRYSDDLTFSTSSHDFDRSRAICLIQAVTEILTKNGLTPNRRKTIIVPPGGRKIVLGLIVDESSPKLTKEFRSTLRQHLYYLEKFGPEAHMKARGFESIWGLYNHVRGKIDFANMIDAQYANQCYTRFNKIAWPSEK